MISLTDSFRTQDVRSIFCYGAHNNPCRLSLAEAEEELVVRCTVPVPAAVRVALLLCEAACSRLRAVCHVDSVVQVLLMDYRERCFVDDG